MRVSEAMDAYCSVRAQEGFSPSTLKQYRYHVHKFLDDIGDIEISDVTLQHFRDHFAKQNHLKITSLAAKVRTLKAVFGWFYGEEYVAKNPTLKLKEPKQPKRVPKALTIDEIEMLRDSCKTLQEHALVEFFFATGCRVGEVVRLNRNAIDWQRGAVTVLGKGNKEREVYFGAKARIWLQRYLSSRKDTDVSLFVTRNKPHRPTTRNVELIFKRVATRCGLEERVTPHVLRHTLATTLLNQGAPLVAVQSILGHEKPETTQLYAVLSGAARQQAYQRYFVQ